MRWEDEDRVGAHFTLPGSGSFHPVVKLGEKIFRAPAVTLSWAPEFEPGSAREGKNLLVQLAKASGGLERLAMAGLFAEAPESLAKLPLAPSLVALAVALLLAEVFLRRFYSGRPKRSRKPKLAGAPVFTPATRPAIPGVEAPTTGEPKSELPPVPEPPMKSALEIAIERARKRNQR